VGLKTSPTENDVEHVCVADGNASSLHRSCRPQLMMEADNNWGPVVAPTEGFASQDSDFTPITSSLDDTLQSSIPKNQHPVNSLTVSEHEIEKRDGNNPTIDICIRKTSLYCFRLPGSTGTPCALAREFPRGSWRNTIGMLLRRNPTGQPNPSRL
jgi:hypothetical protein